MNNLSSLIISHWPWWSLVGLLVFNLVIADYFRKEKYAGFAKIVCSLGLFIFGIELYVQSAREIVALLILVGVGLGVLGDVFLISKKKIMFIFGMIAFFIGHLFYISAFLNYAINFQILILSFSLLIFLMAVVLKWIYLSLSKTLKFAVPVYMVALALMCSTALATNLQILFGKQPIPILGLGALLFTLSDFFVAQHRFKQPKVYDRIIGLPLYYLGQMLLVSSIAIGSSAVG